MRLQCFHFLAHFVGLKHGNCGFLERHVGATVEVRAAATNGLDEFLRTDDPGDALARVSVVDWGDEEWEGYPAWEAESLSQAVDEDDIVFVDIDDIVGSGDGATVAVTGVIVPAVELVHDERRSI